MFGKNECSVQDSAKLTHLLISICVAVFFVEVLVQFFYGEKYLSYFINEFGFSLANVMNMNFITFFTSIFIHAGPEHLLFNIIALYFFGRVVEEQLGWKKYLAIFFISAIAGDFAIIFMSLVGLYSATVPTVGASAAIFGLLGVSIFLKPFDMVIYPYVVPVPLMLIATLYILYNVMDFALVIVSGKVSEISYAAHIGGFIAGLLIGLKIEGKKKGFMLILLFLIIAISFLFLWKYLIIFEKLNYMSIFSHAVK